MVTAAEWYGGPLPTIVPNVVTSCYIIIHCWITYSKYMCAVNVNEPYVSKLADWLEFNGIFDTN